MLWNCNVHWSIISECRNMFAATRFTRIFQRKPVASNFASRQQCDNFWNNNNYARNRCRLVDLIVVNVLDKEIAFFLLSTFASSSSFILNVFKSINTLRICFAMNWCTCTGASTIINLSCLFQIVLNGYKTQEMRDLIKKFTFTSLFAFRLRTLDFLFVFWWCFYFSGRNLNLYLRIYFA